MTIFERPALREYAATCNDLSGFEDRKYTDEAHAKTRPPDDCVATRTGRLSGLNGTRRRPATPSGSVSSRRSRGDRLSWPRYRLVPRACRGSSTTSIPPGRAWTAQTPKRGLDGDPRRPRCPKRHRGEGTVPYHHPTDRLHARRPRQRLGPSGRRSRPWMRGCPAVKVSPLVGDGK